MSNDSNDAWVTQAELEAMRQPIDPPGLYELVAASKLRAKAAAAADTLIDLALGAANESVRLRAATYILDRALGPVANPRHDGATGNKAPWDDVYAATLIEPSKAQLPNLSNLPPYQNQRSIEGQFHDNDPS